MCGLAGFFNTHQTIDDQTTIITRMIDRLSHRGPNSGGIWFDKKDGITLGHRRLAVMDLSKAGHQPMQSQHGRYIIVYNGEIYNASSLKMRLNHHTFQGHSDTEVILALIEKHGLQHTLTLINGMFALALWDKKEKILYLARDRIGEKPLYYGLVNQTLVFASELKAIQAYPHFEAQVAPTSVSAFMQYGYIPAPLSIYENIHKLLPGTYISFSHSTKPSTPQAYWSALDIAEKGVRTPLSLSDREATQQLDQRLNHIIKTRMVADVSIGAFLSGGVDSSLVTALMQANSSRIIKTFTIGFHEQKYNEAKYAKAIAQHLKTDHTELYIDAHTALSIIPQLPHIYDEPFADSSAIPTFLVSKLARQQVSVSLSGDGGDELFGGYNRYLWGQTIWSQITWLPHFMRVALQKTLLASTFFTPQVIENKLCKLAAILTANSPAEMYQRLISSFDQVLLKRPYTNITQLYPLDSMSFIEKMMITDTLSYLPDDIMVKVDRAGMAVSLENRAPFLDHELFEWIWTLPPHMKIRHKATKWLLRQVLSKYVPDELTRRPKMGFGVPLDIWLRGPLRDWAYHLLDKTTIEQQGFLHAKPILEKWQQHLSGKQNWQYQLWTVLMFQAWMEKCKKDCSSF